MAATDYFNQIHRTIVQNSGATLSLQSQEDLNNFLLQVKQDIGNLTGYINTVVYPIFQGSGTGVSAEPILCWGPKWEFDVAQDGLAATTLQTFPEEHGGGPDAAACYWYSDGAGGGRPRTIKETIDCLLSTFSQQIVSIEQAEVDLSPIEGEIECVNNDLKRIIKDAFGCDYALDCDEEATMTWPLAKHIFEIFRQVIIGHGQLAELGAAGIDSGVCSGQIYPQLSLSVLQSDVQPNIGIGLNLIESICSPDEWPNASLRDDLISLHNFLGQSSDVCNGSPNFANACIAELVNKSVTEAILILAEEVCKKCESSYTKVSIHADGGQAIGEQSISADSCGEEFGLIAGEGVVLEGVDQLNEPGKIKISFSGVAGEVNLNDSYHFSGNPPYHLGIIALNSEFENTGPVNNSWNHKCNPLPGAGLYLLDDTPELKSKLLAVVSDYKSGDGSSLEASGPFNEWFSVGAHWGLSWLEENQPDAALLAKYSLPWQRKVVHTGDSLFYMRRIPNYSDNVFLPATAGSNDNGSVDPETGVSDILPPHGVTCPEEGAIWISGGHDPANPNFPETAILDACGQPLKKSHLYYRMPGNGAVYRLSNCGENSLQSAYDIKLGDKGAGGLIELGDPASTNMRSFFLMQPDSFITPGSAASYWPTSLWSQSGSPIDPDCPYYIPSFVIGEKPSDWVDGQSDVKALKVMDRFFSVQHRDQCTTDCDFYMWAETEQDPNNPTKGKLKVYWRGNVNLASLAQFELVFNSLGIDFANGFKEPESGDLLPDRDDWDFSESVLGNSPTNILKGVVDTSNNDPNTWKVIASPSVKTLLGQWDVEGINGNAVPVGVAHPNICSVAEPNLNWSPVTVQAVQLNSYCCADADVGDQNLAAADAYFSVTVNYSAVSLTNKDNSTLSSPTPIEIYLNTPDAEIVQEGLQSFELLIDLAGLKDSLGNQICNNVVARDAEWLSTAIVDNNFSITLEPAGNSQTKIRLYAERTDTCIPATGDSADPCSPSAIQGNILLAQITPGYDALCHATIDAGNSGKPVIGSCLSHACSSTPALSKLLDAVCCIEENPTSAPPGSSCTPWPSVHFWQSPTYYSCMPTGWAPNTCHDEGVLWVGGKLSNDSDDLTDQCTLYFREPNNGDVHNLLEGISGGVSDAAFVKFYAAALDEANGEGSIDDGPTSYTAAGPEDKFKLYATRGIRFITESAAGSPLPGSENALALGFDYGAAYPANATKMIPWHFEYDLSASSSQIVNDQTLIRTAFGSPILGLHEREAPQSPVWRNLNLGHLGTLSDAVELVTHDVDINDISKFSLNFRRLKAAVSDKYLTPIKVEVGETGEVNVLLNPSEIPLSSLKDVEGVPEDGDTLFWSEEDGVYKPTSAKPHDIFSLEPMSEFPENSSCDRGSVVFIDDSESVTSGFYIYNGQAWVSWAVF